jgi:hypothetical protein
MKNIEKRGKNGVFTSILSVYIKRSFLLHNNPACRSGVGAFGDRFQAVYGIRYFGIFGVHFRILILILTLTTSFYHGFWGNARFFL